MSFNQSSNYSMRIKKIEGENWEILKLNNPSMVWNNLKKKGKEDFMSTL